jgi:uncharacterized DUF497 family protein
VNFEWDTKKAAANLRKHWVSFGEAIEVFDDPNLIENEDASHSYDEARFIVIGYSARRLLLVVFTEPRWDVIRIVSARLPTPAERKMYERQER